MKYHAKTTRVLHLPSGVRDAKKIVLRSTLEVTVQVTSPIYMIWFTSDLHFGHFPIIEFCHRPYAGLEEMKEALIENINDCVSPCDTLILLGDVSFHGTQATTEIITRLNGHKVLVRGNHDKVKTREVAIQVGYQEIYDNTSISIQGRQFNMSHYPYRGDSGSVDRYPERRPHDDGRWLLHGHVHQGWKVKADERMINVGVDVWGWKPINEHDIISIVKGEL